MKETVLPFQIANVLYPESPAGVGFSFTTDNNYTSGDDEMTTNSEFFYWLNKIFVKIKGSDEFFL